MDKNIVLIGFKGSGKTVIGKLLAGRLKKTFVDIDEMIELLYAQKTSQNHSVRSIFKSHGEHYFRQLEHEALVGVATGKGMVVSTGGGAVMDERNRGIIKKIGTVVYLDVDKTLLLERSMQNSLAAIYDKKNPEASFKALYKEREGIYTELAHHRIGITNEPKAIIVDRIVEQLHE
ncbi:MAG: shikimate kinase [Nanoarchaeota archaeon]|nr:shikimate kinase [Nanoarchaeota archaeon]